MSNFFDIGFRKGTRFRIYKENTDPDQLFIQDIDHDLELTILTCDGWKLQYGDDDPIELRKNDNVFIGKNRRYDIIVGNGDLSMKIKYL